MLARCAEPGTFVGAGLRPGDESFSYGDVQIAHDLVVQVRAQLDLLASLATPTDEAPRQRRAGIALDEATTAG